MNAKATLLRLTRASDEYNIPEKELRDLIEEGRLEFYELDESSGRVWLIAKDEIAALAAERFISRKMFEHLEGKPISVSDAGFKYQFHTGTISKWIQQGHIRVLERTTNTVLINEADIAYAKALADLKGIKRGTSLFK